MLRIIVYTPQDEFVCEISPNDIFSATLDEKINAQHSLSLVTSKRLEKEQRIIIQDGTGKYREFVVAGSDERKENSERPFHEYECVWSLQHDLKLVDVSPIYDAEELVSAAVALRNVLGNTARWNVGTVTVSMYAGAAIYQKSAWEGLADIIDVWGGEVDSDITVDYEGVVSRAVSLYAAMGNQTATRRFDYARDMTSIHRRVDEMPVACRIRPLGKSYKTIDELNIKITVEEVNDGKDYIQNDAMVPYLRLPNGSGGWEYPTVDVENSSIEDEEELLEWGQSVLSDYTTPKVTYEATVMQFGVAGMDVTGIGLGDKVQCVDKKFGDTEIRIEERVVAQKIDLLAPNNTTIILGDVTKSYTLTLGGTISRLNSRVTNLSAGMSSTAEYLNNLLEHLNEQINATGGYTYVTRGQGLRTYDKAVSDPLVGAEADAVVEVKGGTIRIANSRKETGEWDWKSVFTSGHVAAELVTAAHLTAGYIGSPSDDMYVNFDTHEYILGGRTVQQLLSDVDSAGIDAIEYGISSSSTTVPTSWSTSVPTSVAKGSWLWIRTTYKDGGTSTTKAYAGTDGQNGADGTDGVGIASTVIEYGISAYAATQPSTWSTTPPTSLPQATWLWVRTTYTYSDQSTKTVYTKSYTGADGTSVTILGSYDTLAQLEAAHPTGSMGDGYIVSGYLYVWNGGAWENVGQIQGPQGPQGPRGATGNGISSHDVTYGVSDSATAHPDSWSGSVPTVTQGKWLWTRTVIGYTDGTDSTSYSKSYVGTDGEDGATGATGATGPQGPQGPQGTSVTVTSTEYGTSASASTQPETWTTTPPTSIAKGTWQWTRVTFSNGSTATNKSYAGTDGEDGTSTYIKSWHYDEDTGVTTLVVTDGTQDATLTISDGEDGTNGTNGLGGYVHTAWANSADGRTDFSTTVSAGKSYLGVYTDNAQADSQSPSAYSWSLIKGADGAKGDKGDKGDTGDAARAYSIVISPDTLKRDGDTITPSELTVSATVAVGKATPAIYMGRFRVEEFDGTTWATTYTSAANESSKTYQPTSAARMIRCTLFAAGGTTTRLDSQTVPVLADGSDGIDGTDGTNGQDAYSVWLTNDSHTFPASNTAAIAGSTNTYVKVYRGSTLVRPVTIGTLPTPPTGMTLTRLNNGSSTADAGLRIDVTTALTTRSGTIDIPVTADGRSFTVTLSWALALKGDDGVGIVSIVPQYYLSTSSTTQTGGSWSDAEPTWTSGKYIWTRSYITWDNGTTETTTPTLASALNSANQQANEAKEAVSTLDDDLDQDGIFNRLTNNGQTQGIYLQNGKLYINGSYIQSGTISGDRISGGTISGVTVSGITGSFGGFTIESNRMYNNLMMLTDNALLIKRRGTSYYQGGIASATFSDSYSVYKYGLYIGMANQANFIAFGYDMNASGMVTNPNALLGYPFMIYTQTNFTIIDTARVYNYLKTNRVNFLKPINLCTSSDIYVDRGGGDTASGINKTVSVRNSGNTGSVSLTFAKGILVSAS